MTALMPSENVRGGYVEGDFLHDRRQYAYRIEYGRERLKEKRYAPGQNLGFPPEPHYHGSRYYADGPPHHEKVYREWHESEAHLKDVKRVKNERRENHHA